MIWLFTCKPGKADPDGSSRRDQPYSSKDLFEEIFEHNVDPAVYVEEKGLKVVNDESALKTTIEGILAANPQSVDRL